jgi:hypothetical protein
MANSHRDLYVLAPGHYRVFGNNGGHFENGGHLETFKATKIVEDNYPLQSGHKFTTNNEVSLSF